METCKTYRSHLSSSSTYVCRSSLGSSATSALPLLFVPLFLSDGLSKKVVLQTRTSETVYLCPPLQPQSQLLLQGGTSIWDAEVHVQLRGGRRGTSPHHPMLRWPKLLAAVTSPLCPVLSAVHLLGVLHHLHRRRTAFRAETASREPLPQGWITTETQDICFAFASSLEMSAAFQPKERRDSPEGNAGCPCG